MTRRCRAEGRLRLSQPHGRLGHPRPQDQQLVFRDQVSSVQPDRPSRQNKRVTLEAFSRSRSAYLLTKKRFSPRTSKHTEDILNETTGEKTRVDQRFTYTKKLRQGVLGGCRKNPPVRVYRSHLNSSRKGGVSEFSDCPVCFLSSGLCFVSVAVRNHVNSNPRE